MDPAQPSPEPDQQAEVVAFLRSRQAYPDLHEAIAVFETHGALVFAIGDDVYKIKRAIKYTYMDFSTLEKRRLAIVKELAINRPHAPELYLGVVPITRDESGTLHIGGQGQPIEWALHMRRFDQANLLSTYARTSGIDRELAREIADVVIESHARAVPNVTRDGADRTARIVEAIIRDLKSVRDVVGDAALVDFDRLVHTAHNKSAACLDERARAGYVRRCHGDLHLRNIVLWRGRPTLFDALEFDDELATIDTLYDLSFLLMDLDHRGLRDAANMVFNRYISRSQPGLEIRGLVALPLFLGLRSSIRALVEAQRSGIAASDIAGEAGATARSYLHHALHYLSPPTPALLAVGGLSGTGKSTLAGAIAPRLPPTPGALHVRSDVERKAMFGASPTERLPPASYTKEINDNVYARVLDKAGQALSAGHSVVVDAVFSKADERDAVANLARLLGVPFVGLWLTAPRDTLLARVSTRTGDASDATAAVVEMQLAQCPHANEWREIDAGGTPESTLRNACLALEEMVGLADIQ